ncbi:MAG: LysM peptidoglycan-binding domain-containing protein [Opitutales bacterium]|jgi:LysM repeat protein|nr:LysM peptidoglycan-binding domain-containing protein [Opitutales bacterium]
MKASKIFGFVLCLHLGVITVLIVQPGCRTTQPPTQTYQQDRTIRTNVEGASRTPDGLIEATRTDSGSTLDAAFNAGMDSGSFAPDSSGEFNEFNDVAPLDPIVQQGSTVNVAGSSFETYTVNKGDSLWGISKRYSVSLNELYAANGLNKNSVLKIGQQIQIPVEGGTAMVNTVNADAYQPTSFNTGSVQYKVKGGDTLSKIAKQHDTTVRAIKAANGKTSDMIRVGETLVIPVSGSTGSVAPAPVNTVSAVSTYSAPTNFGSARTHTVKAGEYPATIARKYGMTSGELLALNGITDPRTLQIGQTLKVSTSGSAANVDTKTETVVAPKPATTSLTTTYVPPANNGPIEIRVIEADPLLEDDVVTINDESMFENAVEIPVIRMEE